MQATQFLRLLMRPGDCHELRVLNPRGLRGRGWYDDPGKLAADACEQSGRGRGCYVTLNPTSRQPAPYSPGSDATKAVEITRRGNLLLDFDAVRPNSDDPATEGEHQATIDRARQVKADLEALGFPAPIFTNSGNGAALLYRIDLPAGDATVKLVLQALSAKYSDEAVKLDTTVHDAARVTRIPGTLNRKGTATAERPYRMATIIDAPETLEVVPRALLESVAGRQSYEDDAFEFPEMYPPFDVAKLLTDNKIAFQVRDGELFGAKGKWYDLTFCPHKPEPNATGHTGIFQGEDGRIVSKCHHDGCRDKDWLDFLAKIDPTYIDRAKDEANGSKLSITDPRRLAESFRKEFDHPDHPRLMLWESSIMVWDRIWTEYSKDEIKTRLQAHVGKVFDDYAARLRARGIFDYPPKTSSKLIGDTLLALTSIIPQYKGVKVGDWLTGTGPDASGVVVAANGIIDLNRFCDGNDCLIPHTPRFLATSALPYDFDPNAPAPQRLNEFLTEVFPDENCRKLVQEIFGFTLSPDQRYQVFIVFQGVTAGGKGTITRLIVRMIGEENACSVDFDKLAQRFGLQEAVDKQLIVMPEAKLPERENGSTEMVKKLTGQDSIQVDRKNLPARSVSKWGAVLIVSNADISPQDPSGAFYRRMIPLRFVKSFSDNEDTTLGDKLAADLPGTLLWAIEGWKRLRDNGKFTMPASSAALKDRLQSAGSPLLTFGKECCVTGANERVEKDELYRAYCEWCEAQGKETTLTKDTFSRRLYEAIPGVESERPMVSGERLQLYKGISLRREYMSKPKPVCFHNGSVIVIEFN
jgi:P4 family phage/plasmid primase-like protien